MGNECCSNCNGQDKTKELQDILNHEIADNMEELHISSFRDNSLHLDNKSNLVGFLNKQSNIQQADIKQAPQSESFEIRNSTRNTQNFPPSGRINETAVGINSGQVSPGLNVQVESALTPKSISQPVLFGDEQMIKIKDPTKINLVASINKIINKFEDSETINQERPFALFPFSLDVYKNEITGDIFNGDVLNNIKQGFGRLICQNGNFYEGFWENNQYHGQGFYIDPEGNYIRGEFKDHKPNGQQCILKKRDGSIYKGEMKNGEKDGYGEEITSKGMKYKGYYKNGKMDGHGEYILTNMYSYVGDFSENFIQGEGKCVWKTQKSYDGQWNCNKMHGKGVFYWPDGKSYSGDFVNDKFEGTGKFKWQNGTCYEGEWNQSKMHGKGKIITSDGKQIIGNWVDGEYKWQGSSNSNLNS